MMSCLLISVGPIVFISEWNRVSMPLLLLLLLLGHSIEVLTAWSQVEMSLSVSLVLATSLTVKTI